MHEIYNFENSLFLEFNLLNIAAEQIILNENSKKITLNQCFIYNKNIAKSYEDFECSICRKSLLNSKSNLYKTNEYLIIILNYGKNKKIKINIHFDEYINLDEFIEKNNNENFRLFDTFVHYGDSSSSGHYISYCRNDINNKLYKFNDIDIEELSYEELIKENTTYILFYEKIYDKIYNCIKYYK